MKFVILIASLALAAGSIGCGTKDADSAPNPETVAAATAGQMATHQGGQMGAQMGGAQVGGQMGAQMGAAQKGGQMGAQMGAHQGDPGAGDHGPMIGAYESARRALAADDLATAKAAAKELVTAATGAHAPIGTAAAGIAEAADIAAARLAFGETSKALITMLSEMPPMAKGLHAFHCPMAKGYQKWVQPSATLENPYMGRRMPTCGDASEMTP